MNTKHISNLKQSVTDLIASKQEMVDRLQQEIEAYKGLGALLPKAKNSRWKIANYGVLEHNCTYLVKRKSSTTIEIYQDPCIARWILGASGGWRVIVGHMPDWNGKPLQVLKL